ncbi:helix-turn-helix transcriptional regulator [Halalkalibacter sp. APA_J-10(15)]|uniref:AraC family transcriptional regulator n=1 Tax=unclassified Halalkalibacter TaxID=2893063 RepID=UPI001FF14DEA|nr:helix-turn-helix transcriptional regulator [Halalkalibacter sp. APA_J-10(15)]MCK0472237.1 helix-turn-helix transcriptional regulator [Halalkalibacter sp. APA_J-10(15)]
MQRQALFPTLTKHEYLILPESIGHYSGEPDHYVKRDVGTLNNFSIHFILSGTGYVEIDQERFLVKRGDAFLYFPMQQQCYYSSEDDPWDVRWVHFYGDHLQPFLSEKGFQRFILWKAQQITHLEAAHEQLLNKADQYCLRQLSPISIATYAFLIEFITNVQPRHVTENTELDDRIHSLLPQMQDKACEPFELDYWANKAKVSHYYFCRLFKRATQMTPMAFITLCRLQRSKQLLLKDKQVTVKEIAEQSGYTSISYFNKRFLEHEGMTPTEYRQMYH